MSDLVGNPEDQFSRIAAHMCLAKEDIPMPSGFEPSGFEPRTSKLRV